MMKKLYLLFALVFIASASFGQLVINEVLYDPSNEALDGDANGDGAYDQEEDTFIEFINTGTTNFNASGYEIWDDLAEGEPKYVIPDETWIPPGGALVVFGGGTLTGDFGGAVLLTTENADGLNFNNSGEVIVIRDNEGNEILTFDSDALSNNPNESYTRNPDITGDFEQHGDNTPILFSPGTMIDGTPFNTAFVVESITVQGEGGATSIDTQGGTLQMEAMVMPDFADDQSVTWSVTSGENVASISDSGLLTAMEDGTVEVTATANDDSGITGSAEITVTNQSIGIEENAQVELSVYPNPAQNFITVKASENVNFIQVINLRGKTVLEAPVAGEKVDVSKLQEGVYLLKAFSNGNVSTSRFIKL
ncbi:lamin tail domain-containing protein [Halocola ammonii]